MAHINYHTATLSNGLRVVVHQDRSTPLVAVNLLYNVGSRNESPDRTGYAHLFEHLMFGGSKNVPNFDQHIQLAGGESNAFTNADITNFYCTIPAQNLETALWLEADRMSYLNLNEKTLAREKSVVVEEFKETSINQPYGDVWHLLSDLTYKEHSYRWPTIGSDPSHIQHAQLEDVKQFYENYYAPNNAILVLAGNTVLDVALHQAEKHFGHFPAKKLNWRKPTEEPLQKEMRRAKHTRPVSANVLYMAFHMCDRLHADYPIVDTLSDVLASGKSSFFYQRLIKKNRICNSIDAYITGSRDAGLLVIEARPAQNISMQEMEAAIWKELDNMSNIPVSEAVLTKLKNKIENNIEFGGTHVMHKAMNLAYFEWIGKPEWINEEYELYKNINALDIQRVAQEVLRKENCNVMEYLKEVDG